MKPIAFYGHTTVIGAGQPEYIPLPAHRSPDGLTLTWCWRLTWRERIKLLTTGRLWHQVKSFAQPLQPQLLLTERPELTPPQAVVMRGTQVMHVNAGMQHAPGCASVIGAGPCDCGLAKVTGEEGSKS